jgi:hypothetical protein
VTRGIDEAAGTPDRATAEEEKSDLPLLREHPIPHPSEAMQYRAIGLIEGQYVPSQEQFTRGVLKATDGAELDAVLLGRVMNLVRKHLQPNKDYLWVVYPRTREKENSLHVQIMGVWAPEEMGQPLPPDANPKTEPDYFSIRGEIVFQSQEKEFVIVKILTARKLPHKAKANSFKLRLEGSLPAKSVGHFWSLEVSRQGSQLMIDSGTPIAAVPKVPLKPRKPLRKPKPDMAGRPSGSPLPREQQERGGRSYPLPDRPAKPTKPVLKKKPN